MKTKTAVLNGKPDAGNPHVRFDEGEVASAKPRRGSLLYRKLLQVASVLGMTALSLMVFAETEYVNDLKPFDNTIEWDGFWATTNHADVAVSSEMAGLSGGFASSGAFDADPVNLDEFDSRLCTWGEDVFDGFSSERVGMLILVR